MLESYSEKHVVSIATLASEIARGLNVHAFEALEWLALNCDRMQGVEGYSKGRISRDSRPYAISKAEVVGKLRRLANTGHQQDMTDEVLPSANSWGLAAETVVLMAERAGGTLGQRLYTLANRTKPQLGDASLAASSNGNLGPKRWTDSRIAEARAKRDELETAGVRDFAAQTAKLFGVSPQRLRQILATQAEGEIDKRKTNAASESPTWPPTSRRVHRSS